MNKDFAKIPENAESKAVDREIPIRIALVAEDKGILKWRIGN